jgi:uncharacterized SAM-binding protein YcdF (DUF218 family)
MLYQNIYNLFLPPGFFVIILIVFSCWLYKKDRRASQILAAITFCFYIFTIPLFSTFLVKTLENAYKPPLYADNNNYDVIIMLCGGATLDTPNIDGAGHLSGYSANRLLTTAILSKKANLPVIISGGQVFSDTGNESEISKRELVQLGIPEEMIIIENKSRNTAENAKYVRGLLESYNFKKPLLVTSAFHMKRAVLNYSKQEIKVQPFPTDYSCSINTTIRASSFIPSNGAFNGVGLSLKEYLGIAAALILN